MVTDPTPEQDQADAFLTDMFTSLALSVERLVDAALPDGKEKERAKERFQEFMFWSLACLAENYGNLPDPADVMRMAGAEMVDE